MNNKRIRCSDTEFLQAITYSKTYEEVSKKTGQKLSTTISRYARMKNKLYEQNKTIPKLNNHKISQDHNKVQRLLIKLQDCFE
jgi:hypothetical protein